MASPLVMILIEQSLNTYSYQKNKKFIFLKHDLDKALKEASIPQNTNHKGGGTCHNMNHKIVPNLRVHSQRVKCVNLPKNKDLEFKLLV